jgi:hypothetical protein
MTSADAIYETSPAPVSDDGFVLADLAQLVAGSRGRMLDPRRTPVEVTEVKPRSGSFVVRVCAFEDAGAEWELPLYAISSFQFPVGALRCQRARPGLPPPSLGVGAMWRQAPPLERLFMSFLETRAMNGKFHEAEVVLIGEPANAVF